MEAGFGQKLVGLSCPPRFEAHLVLGSGSPRRKELLALLGFPFSVRTADTDELAPAGLSDLETVQYVARQKAEALVPGLLHGEVVLTADTEVWMDGERFVQPASTQEALTMLLRLRGRSHRVITAVWATDGKRWEHAHRITEVHMADLPESWLSWYVQTYQPMDKAGAYGAQEWIGHIGIARLEGDFDTVKGLPLPAVLEVLRPWMA